MPKRTLRLIGLTGLLLLVAGCSSDGHFGFLGYTTRPTFDPSIRTVYMPIFGNESYLRGLEFELYKAIQRELESKSPYKLVSNCAAADTILEGKILSRLKTPNNTNQLGEVRDVEQGLVVEVRWKDLRSGDVLSVPNGYRRQEAILEPNAPAIPWVQITPSASYVPELGGSTASGLDALAKQTARQIVHMMEVWNVNCEP
jgi:hypothetical protein